MTPSDQPVINASSCPTIEELKDFLLGKSRFCEQFADHLSSCPDCFAAIESLSADDELTIALSDRQPAKSSLVAAPELAQAIEIATDFATKRS